MAILVCTTIIKWYFTNKKDGIALLDKAKGVGDWLVQMRVGHFIHRM